MKIGVPKEIKKHEYRVGLTPACVKAYRKAGHEVVVQTRAGEGAGFTDADYAAAGAVLEQDPRRVFAGAEMIVKVKEPLPEEHDLFRPGQILFTYLHLAANPGLTQALMKAGVHGVAYETIQAEDGSLPCLVPMSEIAGRLAVQEAAKYLERPMGGRGVLLAGIPGVQRGRVVILGAGVVGFNAAKMAIGLGAQVTVLDIAHRRLKELDDLYGPAVQTLYASGDNIAACARQADALIGAVLLPGATAPKLVTRALVKQMQPGAVIVDVAVDQGGCCETTKPTTHDDPVYSVDGVLHYCVANMPGAVARTATLALTQQTLPFGLELASKGFLQAARENAVLRRGVNVDAGCITCPAVAQSLGLPCAPLAA